MRRIRKGLSLLVAAATIYITGPSPIRACQICIPFPKKSAADYLIEADTVVLAREDVERPFHFTPIEILKGDPGDEKIELFLDSVTRRILAANPERSIVLAKLKDGKDLAWRRVGLADKDLGPVVRKILDASADWKSEPGSRIAFFAERLGHENEQVRSLAHLEIARAPYDAIRNCADALSREEIRAFLNNVQYIEWHPLYILLLAQSENPADREWIASSFDSSARFGSTLRLAAWATALIEIEEEEAVAEIEKRFFRNRARKPEELKAVIQALSVHGNSGHVHLRDRIASSYQVLLANHPERVVDLISDLTKWRRKELSKPVGRIVSDPPQSIGFQEVLKLRRFLKSAETWIELPSASP